MTDQLVLFAQPRARHSDPETSHAAAQAQTGRAESYILDVFAKHGPLTDDEVCEHLRDWYSPTVKTARSRLTRRGLLVDSGERRPSVRSRPQIVWRMP